jgi:hypothetical protein
MCKKIVIPTVLFWFESLLNYFYAERFPHKKVYSDLVFIKA